ncbi:MAG: endonuclease/exonuclease/phosphatase family protein [Paludibacteraceae bacterium]
MKKIILLALVSLSFVGISAQRDKQSNRITAETNVMTYNIRLDVASDGINKWDNRKERVVQTILSNSADIVGLQEVLHYQLTYIAQQLPDYDWIGVGRDDGIEKGEYSPIFYNTRKFSEVGSGYFWLSKTPMEAGSVGWDAAITRIATWAKLKDNRTGNVVFVLNTHFDHKGQVARRESAKLILQKVHAYTRKEQFPVIVMGDFNSTPQSDAFKSITDSQNNLHLSDTRVLAPIVSGPEWTFHDFGSMSMNKREIIDYVFVKNRVSVLEYKTIQEDEQNGFSSDHCPVLVQVAF